MHTPKRGSTSARQVTSIRLEPELKERLREISGEQGYQTLIRDVLWQFVERQVRSDELLRDSNWQLRPRKNGFAPQIHTISRSRWLVVAVSRFIVKAELD